MKKIQAERPLGLDAIKPDDVARIEVQVSMKGDKVAHIEAILNSLIVSPAKTILYLESACSSDASAHALMGCIADDTGTRVWNYFGPRWREPMCLNQPRLGGCNDYAAEIPGFGRKLHHVAIVEKMGELILAKSEDWLWQKLRSIMSCPTLSEWGPKVMPAIMSDGLLVKCESFGIDSCFTPYVLADEASVKFDRIIGEHVRSIGGIPKRRPGAENVSKAVA